MLYAILLYLIVSFLRRYEIGCVNPRHTDSVRFICRCKLLTHTVFAVFRRFEPLIVPGLNNLGRNIMYLLTRTTYKSMYSELTNNEVVLSSDVVRWPINDVCCWRLTSWTCWPRRLVVRVSVKQQNVVGDHHECTGHSRTGIQWTEYGSE